MRERKLRHFLILDPTQQRQAIARLASSGMSMSTIAAATSLSVEQIQRVLEEAALPTAAHLSRERA